MTGFADLFWAVFENFKSIPILWGYFFHGKSYAYTLTKNGWGYILGNFALQPTGHPVCGCQVRAKAKHVFENCISAKKMASRGQKMHQHTLPLPNFVAVRMGKKPVWPELVRKNGKQIHPRLYFSL
jgi:hypothetical protein